ncbi:MAG TPA: pitrilysin family protein, partial [Frankiaceae bacterium]|nr:pitrilysin family protein [Frankiaceae bacterium]
MPASGATDLADGTVADGTVRRTVLPGGVRVLTQTVPGVRSVSFGIWVGVGSRDETPATAGCSHYLEHLLFKGTRRRDAMTISASIEAVGGELNAFTTKEYTCYYARVLDVDLPLAVDVVCDMVTSSLLAPVDVDAERGVILEEIAMHDDDPGDAVHDLFATAVLGDTPLGRPVLGTAASIEGLSRSTIAGYYHRRYTPPVMVVAAAGNLDHERVVELVGRGFGGRLPDGAAPAPHRGGRRRPAAGEGVVVTRRPTEQANVVLGTTGVTRRDERRFALGLLSAALGEGMSSRLFQEVREKRGLAYSVYSFSCQYAD